MNPVFGIPLFVTSNLYIIKVMYKQTNVKKKM